MTLDLENALQTSPLSEVIAEFWVKQRECARQELEQTLQRQIEALKKQWQGGAPNSAEECHDAVG